MPIVQRVAITGLGLATPSQVLTNDDLVARFGLDVDDAWIVSRTGIRARCWLSEGETTSDLAARAAVRALEQAGAAPSEVDRLLLATITPDYPSPSTATIVARKIGARCMAVDLSAACAGFLYGLDLGVASIRNGARRVLVVAADARSRFLDPTNRRALVLFGDGAAAAVLEPRDEGGDEVLATFCGAEGREDMGAWVPAGGAARPASAETVRDGLHYVQVASRNRIFDDFIGLASEAAAAVLAQTGLTVADVDRFVPHQGNALLVRDVAAALGVPPHKTIDNIARYGNTAGAALPMGLVDACADGRIRSGDTVLLVSVGAGHAFGAAVVRRGEGSGPAAPR